MPKKKSVVTEQLSQVELQRRWAERVRTGNFSVEGLKVGTIRVFGKSGDAPVNYPIVSLDALPTLAPEEVFAVRQAEAIVREHTARGRNVMAVTPNQPECSHQVQTFDPMVDSYLVLNQIAGG